MTVSINTSVSGTIPGEAVSLTDTGLAIGGSAPTEAQKAQMRAGLGGVFASPEYTHGIVRIGNLSRIRAALKAATPENPITIVRAGDSTTAGAGAGDGTQWGDAANRNSSAQFTGKTAGIISNKSFCGDALMFSSPGYGVYNNSVTISGGWGVAEFTLGGMLFRLTSGGSGVFRMALSPTAKKVRIYWLSQPSSMTIQTDIGVVGQLPTTNTGKIEYFDVSIQLGAAYVELVSTTGTFYVLGMAEIDSTQKAVLLNAGANGAKVADFALSTNNWSALPVLKKIAPTLTILGLTINDANAATAAAVYGSTLASIVEGAMISGDVVLDIGAVSNTAQSTDGSLYGIRMAMMDIAEAYNLTVLSSPAVLGGSHANAVASSYMADNWHPNYLGYTQIAERGLYPLWQHIYG